MRIERHMPGMRTVVLLAGVLLAPLTPAEAWNLAPCSPDAASKRAATAKELREAKLGSLKYLPHPFPRNANEVIADYKHQVVARWGNIPREQLRPGQTALIDGLRRDTLRIEVVTVENWGVRRCSDPRSGDRYFLLTITDASGREIARAALEETGSLEQTGFASGTEAPLVPPSAVAQRVAKRFGSGAESPVYVTTTGSLRCDVLMPCVATRAQGSVYLVSSENEVFEIPAQRRLLSLKDDLGSHEKRNSKLNELKADNEVTTSLGGDVFVALRKHGRLSDK